MPQFPNTVQEGRKGGGYDVMINGSIFIQFKIPEYLKKSKQYQIKIDTNSKQHLLLKELNKPANDVYYASPKFHLLTELEDYYNYNTIEENSVFFIIQSFPNDFDAHKLTYDKIKSYGILHSDRMQINISREIHSFKSTTSYRPDIMPLTQKAKYILQFIKNVEPSVNVLELNENIIDKIFSILLIRYNILWIPFIGE